MPRKVGVELGYKVNMGDYETYDVRYWIEDDVQENEKVVDAHKRVEGLVSRLLWDEVAEARKLSTSDRSKARKAKDGQ